MLQPASLEAEPPFDALARAEKIGNERDGLDPARCIDGFLEDERRPFLDQHPAVDFRHLVHQRDGLGDTLQARPPLQRLDTALKGLETERTTLDLGPDRYAYVHVARGSLEVNGEKLGEGDGARIRDERQLRFAKGEQAEVLVFDLRPHERPTM